MVLDVKMFIKKDVLYEKLSGELDQNTVEEVRVRTIELIDKYHIRFLVLDFEKLSFMDSSGIGFIIGRYNTLRQIDGNVILVNLNDQIARIVSLSGLTKICLVMDNDMAVDKYLEGKNE